MRCKLIKEYAQLLKDDESLWVGHEDKLLESLEELIDIILHANADKIKQKIEEYKKLRK